MAAKKAPLKAKDNKVVKTDTGHRPATPVEIAAYGI